MKSSLPVGTKGSSTSPSATVTTSNANDFIFGLVNLNYQGTSISAGSCCTLIDSNDLQPIGSGVAFVIVSSAQTGKMISFTSGKSANWTMLVDAVVQHT
jgi:hypothetical protein